MIALAAALAFAPAEFALWDLEGTQRTLRTGESKATAVIFVSTVCPVSQEYEQRYAALFETFSPLGVRFAFVYSNRNEPVPEIRKHSAGFAFPVYRDEGQRAADLFEAAVTPTAVLLNSRGEVVYRGRIDDSAKPARVKDRSLENAIRALLAGKRIKVRETRAFG